MASYAGTDATTAVADAIDGLFDSLVDQLGGATAAANGKGVTITESDTLLTITTDVGVAIVSLENSHFNLDTEVATCVATTGAVDADAIDCSAKFRFESAGAHDFAKSAIEHPALGV